jgi:hypothetical protein
VPLDVQQNAQVPRVKRRVLLSDVPLYVLPRARIAAVQILALRVVSELLVETSARVLATHLHRAPVPVI